MKADLTPRQTSIVLAQIAAAADQLQKLASEMRDTQLEPAQDAVRDTICSLLGRLRTAELLAGQIGALAEMHLDEGDGFRANVAAWLLGEHFAEPSAA